LACFGLKVMLTISKVFIWVGSAASDVEKKLSLKSAQVSCHGLVPILLSNSLCVTAGVYQAFS